MTVLADVLDVAGQPERISVPADELFVTVKLNCGGAVQRVIKSGKVPVPFTGYRVRAGQFIYSRIDARNGAFAIVPEELHGAVVSKDFPVFDVRHEQIDERYLVHFLRAGRLQEKIRAASFGATNRRRITEEHLLGFEIFLPPLDEQRRIAATLDQADTIRTKRRQTLAHLGDLTKSIFHEMFDDQGSASGGIDLGNVVKLTGGRNLVADDMDAPADYRVLKISAVTSGRFNPLESKPLPDGYTPPIAHLVRPNDLLMSRANTAALVGATAFVGSVPDRIALPDKIWRFDWIVESEPKFYHALLSMPATRRKISRLASGTGGSMKNVPKGKLLKMQIPNVSIARQRDFVGRTDVVDTVYERVQRALAADDELFASLQSRAFRGEL